MTEDHTKLPRLYVGIESFSSGKKLLFSDVQAHYLRNVMRLGQGSSVRVFNGQDGEWICKIDELNKKNVIGGLVNQLREQKSCPDIVVLASPVKKDSFDIMIEKASELGARAFYPVRCERTIASRVNPERMGAIAIEAAEQCERLDIMQTHDILGIKNLLKSWDKNRKLIFCLERGGASPIVQAMRSLQKGVPLGLLTGPEGGFSPNEIEFLRSHDFVLPVSLGPRILRAETAMIAALSCIQAQVGDWS